RYVFDFANRRRVSDKKPGPMNRLYAVEATPTATGLFADHRLPLASHMVGAFAAALAGALAGRLRDAPEDVRAGLRRLGERGSAAGQARWVAALAKDLAAREAGTTLVIPGEGQPAAVHALAHVLNRALGNVGRTVRYTRPVEARPEVQAESLARLVRAMR